MKKVTSMIQKIILLLVTGDMLQLQIPAENTHQIAYFS